MNGALTVMLAAKKAGVKRLVYASSVAVYGDTKQLPVDETVPPQPQSPYAIHKLWNEQYGQYLTTNEDFQTIGLRYFNVWGPRQDPDSPYSGVISLCYKHLMAQTEFTVFGDGEQTRDFVSVYDVAASNLLATTAGTPGAVYNIATGVETSLNDLTRTLETAFQETLMCTTAPERTGDITRSCASIKKAAAELGYTPRYSVAAAIADLCNKYRLT